MKEQKWGKNLVTLQNHPNQTTMWLYYAYYKFYHVYSWGIVVTDVLVMRNGTRNEGKQRGSFCLHRVAGYEPRVATLRRKTKEVLSVGDASRAICAASRDELFEEVD